jgi:hypothetical protein
MIKYWSHKKILDKSQRYKSPVTSCSFEVDDPQEIQERDLLRDHPSDYSLLKGESHTLVIDIKKRQDQIPNQTLRANPKKDWSTTIPIQQELCQCQANILIQPITRNFNVILLSRLTRCQCCKHLVKPRFVSIVDK